MWFEATKVGEYHLFCAEFCGTQHAYMIGKVIAMEPGDYHDWLMGGPTASLSMAEAGEQQFTQLGCQTCHKSESGGRGPSLVGIYNEPQKLTNGKEVVADTDFLRESILYPNAKILEGYQAIMPAYNGQINEQSLNQLVAYIKSLNEIP